MNLAPSAIASDAAPPPRRSRVPWVSRVSRVEPIVGKIVERHLRRIEHRLAQRGARPAERQQQGHRHRARGGGSRRRHERRRRHRSFLRRRGRKRPRRRLGERRGRQRNRRRDLRARLQARYFEILGSRARGQRQGGGEETCRDGKARERPAETRRHARSPSGARGARSSLSSAGREVNRRADPAIARFALIWSRRRSAICATSACARSICLRAADLVACEDTRVTAKLMARYAHRPRRDLPYHEHNAERMRPLFDRAAQGRRGRRAGLRCRHAADLRSRLQAGARRTWPKACRSPRCPGASAALAALVLSGLPSDRFLFAGFLPPKEAARAPARSSELARRARDFGVVRDRAAACRRARRHGGGARRPPSGGRARADQALRGSAARQLWRNSRRITVRRVRPRASSSIVVGTAPRRARPRTTDDALDAALDAALATMSIKDASAVVAAATGRPRRLVYQRALALAGRA